MAFTTFVGGTAAVASEVNENMTILFNNSLPSAMNIISELLVEQDFTSDTSDSSTNLVYNTTLDEFSNITSGSTTLVFEGDSRATGKDVTFPTNTALSEGYVYYNYQIFGEYDECNDSSVDGTLWTFAGAGSSSENTQQLSYSGAFNGTSTITTDQTNGNFLGTDTYTTRIYSHAQSTGGSVGKTSTSTCSFVITDGSASVVIDTVVSAVFEGASNATLDARYTLQFDNVGQDVRVWKDGAEMVGSPFDLSTLSTYYRIQVYARQVDGAGQSGAMYVYYLRKVISTTPSTTITEEISFDEGSNYTTASKHYAARATNNGVSHKVRLTAMMAASEVIVVNNCTHASWTGSIHSF